MKAKNLSKILLSALLVCNIVIKADVKPKGAKAYSIKQLAIADKLYSLHEYTQALQAYTNVANKPENADPLSLLLAQANLANMYYSGIGTPVDYKLALIYNTLVSDNTLSPLQAQSEANSRLANMYRLGLGTQPNYKMVIKYSTAVINNPKASNILVFSNRLTLANLYHFAQAGLKKPNYALALKYYKDITKEINAEPISKIAAQINLGVMNANGEGVKKSATIAQDYYQQALNKLREILNDAKQNDPVVISGANYYLGIMYAYGYGVPNNGSVALENFKKVTSTTPVLYTQAQTIIKDNLNIK
ncbi:MAG: tetratricopeptide repeat protein [Candidatus Babeliales bacterium]|nr:tetratricopeptide repeat protein [Candidatus Babeliales bacterium]